MDNQDAPLQKKIKEYLAENAELLKKHGLTEKVVIDFPRYRQLPVEVQLALAVIQTHGGTYVVTFTEKK